MTIKQMMGKILKESGSDLYYVPYTDSEGNVLKPEDILFVEENKKYGKQIVEEWPGSGSKAEEGVGIYSPNVKWHQDKHDRFPIAITSGKKLLTQKVSKFTGEVLPMYAGCSEVIRIAMVGGPGTGKTTTKVQWFDPLFTNTIARNKNFFIRHETRMEEESRAKFEDALHKFKMNKQLPDPTVRNNKFNSLDFHIGNEEKDCVLVFGDPSGEECCRMGWDSRILNYDYWIFMIGADDLTSGKYGEAVYEKVLEQMIPKIKVMGDEKEYEILVTITKSDLLDKNHPLLKDAFENSIGFEDGRMIQLTHDKGFDYKSFNKKSKAIEAFVKDSCPIFYNSLIKAVPKERISFAMIANVGEECVDNHYENYQPFCIDEPLLYILTKMDVYPVACEDEDGDEEPVVPILPGFLNKMKDLLMIEDDEEDEEEW